MKCGAVGLASPSELQVAPVSGKCSSVPAASTQQEVRDGPQSCVLTFSRTASILSEKSDGKVSGARCWGHELRELDDLRLADLNLPLAVDEALL